MSHEMSQDDREIPPRSLLKRLGSLNGEIGEESPNRFFPSGGPPAESFKGNRNSGSVALNRLHLEEALREEELEEL